MKHIKNIRMRRFKFYHRTSEQSHFDAIVSSNDVIDNLEKYLLKIDPPTLKLTDVSKSAIAHHSTIVDVLLYLQVNPTLTDIDNLADAAFVGKSFVTGYSPTSLSNVNPLFKTNRAMIKYAVKIVHKLLGLDDMSNETRLTLRKLDVFSKIETKSTFFKSIKGRLLSVAKDHDWRDILDHTIDSLTYASTLSDDDTLDDIITKLFMLCVYGDDRDVISYYDPLVECKDSLPEFTNAIKWALSQIESVDLYANYRFDSLILPHRIISDKTLVMLTTKQVSVNDVARELVIAMGYQLSGLASISSVKVINVSDMSTRLIPMSSVSSSDRQIIEHFVFGESLPAYSDIESIKTEIIETISEINDINQLTKIAKFASE